MPGVARQTPRGEARQTRAYSMRRDFERTYHAVEEDHWWFVARREMILSLVRTIASKQENFRILEIGCSGGPLLELLSSKGYFQTYGIDISDRAIQRCRERGLKNVLEMNGVRTSFADETFDLIIASDVLEHIRDDNGAVGEWRRILKRGGSLICFVPAFKILWSKHDEDNEHYRRYTRKSLEHIFRRNNFTILRTSYWDVALFFPVLLYRFLQRVVARMGLPNAQLRESHRFVNAFLTNLLRIENSLAVAGVNYPFGVSVFVVVQRPGE